MLLCTRLLQTSMTQSFASSVSADRARERDTHEHIDRQIDRHTFNYFSHKRLHINASIVHAS